MLFTLVENLEKELKEVPKAEPKPKEVPKIEPKPKEEEKEKDYVQEIKNFNVSFFLLLDWWSYEHGKN